MVTIAEAVSQKNLYKTVEVEGRIIELPTAKTPSSKLLAEAKIADDTAETRVVVWEPEPANVLLSARVGDIARVKGEVRPFRNELNISVGKTGAIKILESAQTEIPPVAEVPEELPPEPLFPNEEVLPIEIQPTAEVPVPPQPPTVTPSQETQLTTDEILFIKKLYKLFKELR